MIEEADCAACDFNRPGKTCDRRLPWAWRGEYLPAKRDEYNMIKRALENETFPGRFPNQPRRTWHDMAEEDQAAMVKKRLKEAAEQTTGQFRRKQHRHFASRHRACAQAAGRTLCGTLADEHRHGDPADP